MVAGINFDVQNDSILDIIKLFSFCVTAMVAGASSIRPIRQPGIAFRRSKIENEAFFDLPLAIF